ncbi:MAG TPA: hypothetical protein VJ997_09950 [Longimicrobiales bacterium]|nr:hypothetical protein [Longimicrobiales bacterium]
MKVDPTPGAPVIDKNEPPQFVPLPPGVSALLLDLAIGVHHHAMYPVDHPSQEPAVSALMRRLADIFVDRRTFTVGVAHRQLVIDGAATDPNHPALSDLARRLHKHQLGALVFNRGVKAKEIREVLATLAKETDIEGIPIGLLPPDDFPTWENARLFRIGYEDLELREGGSGGGGRDRATALWLGLAQVAMPDEPNPDGPEGTTLAARVLEKGGKNHEKIAEYVRHLAYELRGARGYEAEQVRRRLSDFLENLDEETLDRVMDFGGSFNRRKRFLLDANQSLSTDSVLRILHAAAAGGEQGISHSMTRLLSKLSIHAEGGTRESRSLADTAVRDNVEALLEGWDLKDPNPESYTLQLDSMAKATPIFDGSDAGQPLTGATRLIQMALEVDADGEIINKAVPTFVAEQGVGPLLEILDRSPADNRLAERIRSHLATQEQLRLLLADEKVDPESLKVLVDRMGSAAVAPMLDVMEGAESRALRRMIFDALADMGPSIAPELVERLQEVAPWFVLRNNLSLLHRLDCVPEGLDPSPYLAHSDVRVRRAALPVALRSPPHRDAALENALRDEDAYLVHIALVGLLDGVPEELQPLLAERVVLNTGQSDEIRALGVKVLGAVGTPFARDTLLRVAVVGRSIFGRPKLAAGSPPVVAALRALALGWGEDAGVRAALHKAARSKDAEVRSAVGPPMPDEDVPGETAANP